MIKNLNKIMSLLLLCSSWLLLCCMIAIKLFDVPLISDLNYQVFDVYQRIKPRSYTEAGVRIVDIDDNSLAKLGQWPWPRSMVADLTTKLYEAGAAVVAYDIIFPEEDRTSPKHIVPLWGDEALTSFIGKLPDPDQQLARVLQDKPAVTAVSFGDHTQHAAEYDKASVIIRGSLPEGSIKQFDGMIGSLPILSKAAKGMGFINSIPDRDSVVRRVPLLLGYHGQIYPTLGLESLRLAFDAQHYTINANQGLESVRVGDTTVPVDENGMFWIYYSLSTPDRYVPAWKIIQGGLDPEKIAGHIVIIGTSAAGLKDLRATPHDAALPGVEVHAQLVEQILLKEYLQRPDWIGCAEIGSVLVLGVALLLIVRRTGALAGFASMLGLLGITVYGSWHAFAEMKMLFSPVTPVVALTSIYLLESIRRFLHTEQERKQIRDAFSLYLSPALVEKAVANPKLLKLGGENRELTVMFTDIRDFSSYSEKQSPEDLTHFINNFLTPMTDIILDQQGTIDKYIGDCIMAFWNAPLDVADHAVRAARATLAMRAELVKFNERLEVFNAERGSHLSPVRIGMGLNTGICCVGNLGSRLRFNYSALGNAVDISSRLEGQSKFYGVDLVIGEATLVQLKGFAAIEIDLIRVKGKKQAVHIFTLLGDETLAAHADFIKLSTLHCAMLQAYRAQQWHEASAALEEAVMLAKSLELVALAIPVPSLAGLYDLYRTRMVEYAQTPPPADWDGVYVATFK